MIREIIVHPHETLRQKSQAIEVSLILEKKQLFADLVETMLEKDGLGLAGPQIGVLERLVAINTKDGPLVLINPKILKKSWTKKIEEEGCLSVPGKFGLVKRAVKIRVQAYAPTGEKIDFSAQGLFARIIQHEVDHLDGILFIDKLEK